MTPRDKMDHGWCTIKVHRGPTPYGTGFPAGIKDEEIVMMAFDQEFWKAQAHRVILGSDGSLRFTAAGKAYFAPLLARHGVSITQIDTAEAFQAAMGPVIQGQLDENTREMEALLNDPTTSEADREVLLKVLGRTEDSLPMRARLRLVK